VEYADVRGKVTLGGVPLSGVQVTFYPDVDARDAPPYSQGTTDLAGVYTLAGPDGKLGAVVGKHRVVVNWPLQERGGDRFKVLGPPIPVRYTIASETPLIIEVKAGGPHTIDLPLKR
jgi:hypothetical protein